MLPVTFWLCFFSDFRVMSSQGLPSGAFVRSAMEQLALVSLSKGCEQLKKASNLCCSQTKPLCFQTVLLRLVLCHPKSFLPKLCLYRTAVEAAAMICCGRRPATSFLVVRMALQRQNNSFADRCSLKKISSSSRTACQAMAYWGFARVVVPHAGGIAPCLPCSTLQPDGCLARLKLGPRFRNMLTQCLSSSQLRSCEEWSLTPLCFLGGLGISFHFTVNLRGNSCTPAYTGNNLRGKAIIEGWRREILIVQTVVLGYSVTSLEICCFF